MHTPTRRQPLPKRAQVAVVEIDTIAVKPAVTTAPVTPKKVKSAGANFRDLGTLVTFIIGPQKEVVQVHKNPIYLFSPVLKQAFESNLAKGEAETHTMEDVTESVFSLFVKWIYTQKLVGAHSMDELCQDLPRLWIMADNLMIPKLQNEVMNTIGTIRSSTSFKIALNGLKYIYENTRPHSPLRKFALRQYAGGMTENDIVKMPEAFSKEMLLDLVHYLTIRLDRSPEKILTPPDVRNYIVKEELIVKEEAVRVEKAAAAVPAVIN